MLLMVWMVRQVDLVTDRRRWLRDGAAPAVYGAAREALLVAAAMCAADPRWYSYPVEIDPRVEEVPQ